MDAPTRDRVLRLAGIELRGQPHPGQRYKHGWIPIAGMTGDALRIGGRMDLEPGESLVGSDRVGGADKHSTVLLAATDGPRGRRLRVGVTLDEGKRSWTGRNLGGTVVLDEAGQARLRDGLAAMAERGAEAADRLKAIDRQLDDLADRRAEIERRQYVGMTKKQSRELAQLDKDIELEERFIREDEALIAAPPPDWDAGYIDYRKNGLRLQRQKLQELAARRAELVGDHPRQPLSAADAAKLAEIDRAVATLNADFEGNYLDRYLVEGSVDGEWGSISWNAQTDDTFDAPSYQLYGPDGIAEPVVLTAAKLEELIRLLGQEVAADPDARHRTLKLLGIEVRDDPTSEALRSAVDLFLEAEVRTRKWDPSPLVHPRDPGGEDGGQFVKNPVGAVAKILDRLKDWSGGEGSDDPFDGIEREPLRKTAVGQGLKVRRGADRDEIAEQLKNHVRDEMKRGRGEDVPSHRLTLSSPAFRDQDVGVYQEKLGKVSLYRESSTGQRGTRIVSVDSLADLEQWGRDNDEPQVAKWAASERDGGKPAVKKAAPRKAPAAKKAVPAAAASSPGAVLDALAADLAKVPEGRQKGELGGMSPVDTVRAYRERLDSGELTPDQVDGLLQRLLFQNSDAGGPADPTAFGALEKAGLQPKLRDPAIAAAIHKALAGLRGTPAKSATPRTGRGAIEAVPVHVSTRAIGGRTDDIRGLDGMTPRQREMVTDAVDAYRGLGHKGVNGHLRSGDQIRGAKGVVAGIDRAMDASALSEPIVIYRGVGDGETTFGPSADWPDDLTGVEWTDAGYPSTSASRDIAARGGGAVQLRIVAPEGTKAIKLSDFEQEILLERGLTFRVVKDNGPEDFVDGFGETHHADRMLDVEIVPAPSTPRKAPAKRVPATPAPAKAVPAPAAPRGRTEIEELLDRDLGEPLKRRTPREGDVAVWSTPGAEPAVGRVIRLKSGTFIEWDGGQRERVVVGRLDPAITLYGDPDSAPTTPDPVSTLAGPDAADPLSDLRTMDTESARDALDLRKVPELKALIDAANKNGAGLKKTGTKRQLVDRLVEHLGGGGGPKGDVAPSSGAATPAPIHALLDADDATIEAALRDVFEGKFGPYTTKVTVGIVRAGTRVDKRGREHKIEPSIGVTGKIYDANGVQIGDFSRSITLADSHYPDGTVRREIWAVHHVVQLGSDEDENPTKYHGKGFGGAFNRRAIEWYRASGVHGISQKDHNGYVWASQGFNFPGGVAPEYKVKELRDLLAALRAGQTKDRFGETIPKQLRDAPDLADQLAAAEALLARLATSRPGEPGYPTAYEFSQLGRNGRRGKTAVWIGRHLGVPADEMILNPDEGEVVTP